MKTNSRLLINLATVLLAAVYICSCSGNTDPEDEILVLKADKTEAIADGEDHITFTVLYGDTDVSTSAVISCTRPEVTISDNLFYPSEAGEYTFTASYKGAISESLNITVEEAVHESQFQRRVCVMEFTGTWCAQCPEGATTLNYLVNKAYKDKAYALAFHNSDDYAIDQEQELYKIFKWSGYPAYVTDMRDCGLLNEGGCSKSIDKSLYDVSVYCSAALECTYDATSGKVTVKAKVFSEKTMKYRLAAYIVEDKITGSQTMSTGEVQEDYTHRHVVRKMLSANVRGDDIGQIKAGTEVEKTYSFEVDKKWNIENLSVAVLAIDSNSEVNNMATCAVNGGKMNYQML